ncbi:low molecular weight phosphotyrosine protein phosphatase [Aquibium sp. A9E412]|uniref:low molecular weight protein-tyrosine-phosphatase n=1 Tax=Aquibium sp. A9E412 TaxID=2976767 RepID=UPI0025B1DBBC|nr:low molecular weight protein-tyrosine-phosphatase [Aquibium sp. A9E412]MDN2568434.1 low molecular weight phosphotyrosine protein phosphatase [Aquibium sp. A9E412]
MAAKPEMSILFVCLGNICRSPLAEGVAAAALARNGLAGRVALDSAGTGGWHVGSPPDPRSVAVATRHGIDITAQAARRLTADDFERFDLLLGMDASNVAALRAAAPPGDDARVHLFLDYALGRPHDVPDPYFGGADGFGAVYRTIQEASEALAVRLAARLESPPSSGQASSTM